MKKYFAPLLLLLAACGSYTLPTDAFVAQVREPSDTQRTHNVASVGSGYDANTLTAIDAFDKEGKPVRISPNKNTTFQITDARNGKSFKLYYDTVYKSGDSIYGLQSRIVGGKKSIAVKDIASVLVKTEN